MDLLHIENHGKRRRMRSNLEDDPPTTGMEHLPHEIIHDILSRLPISSLVQFKCVCRTWRALAQDPHLVKFHLSATTNSDPCLILHCDFPIRNQLYFVDFAALPDQGKDKVKRINAPFWPIMPEFDVVGSCNGLLCLADSLYDDAVYVYNPFTRKHIELPKSLKYPDQEVVFGFGFHPKTEQYKVVKIVYYRNSHSGYPRARRLVYPQSEVQILTLGSPKWRSLGKIPFQLVRRPSEALVNGRLHWVSRHRRYNPARLLVSLDLADDNSGKSRSRTAESWVKEYSIGTYMPKGLKQNLDRPSKIWKSALNGRVVSFGPSAEWRGFVGVQKQSSCYL
ncbi:hypothetical protein GH714_020612 [Hevea brasiliensis]|uniref:F-box domain-containing protein n=1 Tax=Hevea brasiliensis TaxID=3981 RepID=A0A6A6KTN8_HEVBR|nr:hypothetical protein GH714_020612 [Hevea brasiliensis]